MKPQPFIQSSFTPLEQAVLSAICEAHPEDRASLENQLSKAKILGRENTGAGFYTRLSVKHSSSAPIGGERLRRGPAAKVEGLKHGMGFILWLTEGYAACLEGYSYDENTAGIALERTGFEIVQS